MRDPRSTPIKATRFGSLAAASLLLVAIQAHAASGLDAVCDRSESPAALDTAIESLAIDVVDHNMPKDVDGDELPATMATAPNSPLTELNASGLAEAKDAESISGDDLPSPNSRFPGVSDNEALRYRRQMYRTDI